MSSGKRMLLSEKEIHLVSDNTRDGVLNCLEHLIHTKLDAGGNINFIELSKIILELRAADFVAIQGDSIMTKLSYGAFNEQIQE